MHHYSTTSANINSAEYRLAQRVAQATREQRVAHIRRWLDNNPELQYRPTYRAMAAELAALESEAR